MDLSVCAQDQGLKVPPLLELRHRLTHFEISALDLVTQCLAAIADPCGEGSRTFTKVFEVDARRTANLVDLRLRQGTHAGTLAGIPISIKDLFDVKGWPTTAGSVVLADSPSAAIDATAVRRLKQAGAVLIGRTNMTEFAYSGLGLNPHRGTPRNPYDRTTGRIPGGSSSGAAVSVSDGMSAVAIGSDTGGSVRIPAALCGLVGFKPTARRVPLDGVLPLSPSLDSIGPIAHTVQCCARVDAVLSGEPYDNRKRNITSIRLAVLGGYVLDDLEPPVRTAFERALRLLGRAGASLVEVTFPDLSRIPRNNQLAAAEAFSWHRSLLERDEQRYDPRVAARLRLGATMLAADYLDLLRIRREIVLAANAAFRGFDGILMPTTPRIAPPIESLERSDTAYLEANGAMLRNTSVFNYLDGCSLSIPCHEAGDAPVGLMLSGLAGWDHTVLACGHAIEAVLVHPR